MATGDTARKCDSQKKKKQSKVARCEPKRGVQTVFFWHVLVAVCDADWCVVGSRNVRNE